MSSRKRIDPFVGALIGAGVGAAAIGAFFLYRHLTARQVVKATPASSVPLHRLQTTDDISSEWTAPTTADNVESIFRVTTKNGFLPLVKSLRKLPAEFKELDAVSDSVGRVQHSVSVLRGSYSVGCGGIPDCVRCLCWGLLNPCLRIQPWWQARGCLPASADALALFHHNLPLCLPLCPHR
jgi:hypothetical protein